MAPQPLGRIIAGFVYTNDQSDWNGSIVKVLARSDETFMGEPTFVIELPNGNTYNAIGAQLRPWFKVTEESKDWLAY